MGHEHSLEAWLSNIPLVEVDAADSQLRTACDGCAGTPVAVASSQAVTVEHRHVSGCLERRRDFTPDLEVKHQPLSSPLLDLC